MNNTPNEDESCEMLTRALVDRWPFVHSKFGDGAIEVMMGTAKYERSCDGEPQWEDRKASAAQCRFIWDQLCAATKRTTVILGDWATCSDTQGLDDVWGRMVAGQDFRLVAYEALLLHRLSPALLNFYRTLRELPCKKVLMTSWQNHPAVTMLKAEPVYVPAPREYRERSDEIARRAATLAMLAKPDILLFAAGGVGAEAQAYLLESAFDFTMIQIGSALDPLFRGRTRRGQVESAAAREYFRDLL